MNNFLKSVGALYDETRVQIVAFLLKHGESCVCELQSSTGLIQSRLSRHLGILKDAGYLYVERRGRWAYYGVRKDLDGYRKKLVEEIGAMGLEIPNKVPECDIDGKVNNVLFLCTGNSCRSILAEALTNFHLGALGVKAYSAGVAAIGAVNQNVLELLKERGVPTDELCSKTVDELPELHFDLVITVCDNAKESCPFYPGKTLHFGIVDPTGKEFEEYIKTAELVERELVPYVAKELSLS